MISKSGACAAELTLKPAHSNRVRSIERHTAGKKQHQQTMKATPSTPAEDLAEMRRMNAARLSKNYPAYPKNARLKASGGHYKNVRP